MVVEHDADLMRTSLTIIKGSSRRYLSGLIPLEPCPVARISPQRIVDVEQRSIRETVNIMVASEGAH